MEVKEIDLNDLQMLDKDNLELISKIQENSKIQAHITIKPEPKQTVTIKEEFVITYTDSFLELANLNITGRELKIVAYILTAMEFGNLVSFNQSQMAQDLNIAKSNISYHFKNLKKKGILVENNKHLYMNSNIFQKGLKHKLTEERRENLAKAQGNLVDSEGNTVVLKPTL